MTGDYLSFLYGLLAKGVSSLSQTFREAQVGYVLSTEQPDGGFRGRRGPSDLYYTDFALRVLAICGLDPPDLSKTAEFIAGRLASPGDVVDAFNALNSARLLRDFGYDVAFDRDIITDRLGAQQLPSGGYSRPGGGEISSYNTFLARLCFDLLGEPMPAPGAAVRSIQSLKRRSGGFGEMPSDAIPQTSATAAVLTFLLIADRLPEEDIRDAQRFLLGLQRPEGGLLPCPGAIESDLLSTFTGLSTMFLADSLAAFDLTAAARMVRDCVHPQGGFRGCPSETEPDVEYTFYGLGILALLRLYRDGVEK